jgi:hypothetical protein
MAFSVIAILGKIITCYIFPTKIVFYFINQSKYKNTFDLTYFQRLKAYLYSNLPYRMIDLNVSQKHITLLPVGGEKQLMTTVYRGFTNVFSFKPDISMFSKGASDFSNNLIYH